MKTKVWRGIFLLVVFCMVFATGMAAEESDLREVSEVKIQWIGPVPEVSSMSVGTGERYAAKVSGAVSTTWKIAYWEIGKWGKTFKTLPADLVTIVDSMPEGSDAVMQEVDTYMVDKKAETERFVMTSYRFYLPAGTLD